MTRSMNDPATAPRPAITRRRAFLLGLGRYGVLVGSGALLDSRSALASPAINPRLPADSPAAVTSRRLAFDHLHTRERISIVYAVADQYRPDALGSLNRFLRDHYCGAVGSIDPELFDLLYRIRRELASNVPFEVISGYRSPATNDRLRKSGGGGVARRSLHMEGMAIDIRLPGVALADLRDAARSLRIGGVGYYPGSRFVHVDTGQVRTWQG